MSFSNSPDDCSCKGDAVFVYLIGLPGVIMEKVPIIAFLGEANRDSGNAVSLSIVVLTTK